MAKDPAFLFYPKDWLSGTAEYMPDEKGVYIDLLCHQHQNGSLPIDTERLARIVGLSHESFLKIWSVISVHFEQTDNRLVNRKLNQLTIKRAKKSLINTINGTFAGLLKMGNYDAKTYKYLKSEFDASCFVSCDKSNLTNRINEWITERLKSIGNGNISNYVLLFNKVITENKIELSKEFQDLFLEWLKYKSEKGQTYKETGLKSLLIKTMADCEGDPIILRNMILYSTSKNYDGLFKEKPNGTHRQNNGATSEEILGAVSKYFPIEGFPPK
jgi:hypothetical protein